MFYYTYTFAQFAAGYALDRWNLRWAYGGAVLLWSTVAALTGMAQGFAGLMAFRLMLGVAESVNWPAALRLIARGLPPEERPLGNGIFTSGTSVGALIAPVVILGIADAQGWRWAFAVVGSFGVVWFLVWLWFSGRAGLSELWTGAAATQGSSGYGAVLREPVFWRVLVVTMLVNPCLYFNLNWLPTYFSQELKLPDAKWALTLIYLGLDLGYLCCGGLGLLLIRAGWRVAGARRAVFGLATVLGALSAVVPWMKDPLWLLVVVNFAIGMWIASYLTMAQEVSPANVSTAAGLLGGSGSLAGALAMWAVGRVTKDTGSFALPFLAVAVALVVAFFAGWAAQRRTSQTSEI